VKLEKHDYDYLADLLKTVSGLSLGAGKEYLIESRLMPLCRDLKLAGIPELILKLRAPPSDKNLVKLVNDLMTTNESLFFRDYTPFELIRTRFLPELVKTRAQSKTLTIWSAACSSGQEPYSIAMLLCECGLNFSGWNVKIIATDFSEEILRRAREGAYSQYEVSRGLPADLLLKYFDRREDRFVAKPVLRDMIEFRFANLLQPLTIPRCDVVFLRNVLIYFENQAKTQVIDAVAKIAAEDALLVLGGAESVHGLSDCWSMIEGIRSPIYRRKAKA